MQNQRQVGTSFVDLFPRNTAVISVDHQKTVVLLQDQEMHVCNTPQLSDDKLLLDFDVVNFGAQFNHMVVSKRRTKTLWDVLLGWRMVCLLRNSCTQTELEVWQTKFSQIALHPRFLRYADLQEHWLQQKNTLKDTCVIHFREQQVEVLFRYQNHVVARTMWFSVAEYAQENHENKIKMLRKWLWQLQRWLALHNRPTSEDPQMPQFLISGLSADVEVEMIIGCFKQVFGKPHMTFMEGDDQNLLRLVPEMLAQNKE